MKLTIPQLRLVSEGELYGHYVKDGRAPIDQLINLVQDHFIDWDVDDAKFLKFFHISHPYANQITGADGETYLDEMGGVRQVVLDELESSNNQNKELISKLIKKTVDRVDNSGASGLLDSKLSDFLGIHSGALEAFVIDGMKFDTIRKIIQTDKVMLHRILKTKVDPANALSVARGVIEELENGIMDYVHNGPYHPTWPEKHEFHCSLKDVLDIKKWVKSPRDS